MKLFPRIVLPSLLILLINYGMSQVWSTIDSGFDGNILSLSFLDNQRGAASCTDGIILITDDAGINWNLIQTPVTSTLFDISFVTEDILVAVGSGPVIIRSGDGGSSWSIIPSGINYDLLAVEIDVSGFGIAGGFGQSVIRTGDFGASWQVYQTDMFGGRFSGAHMLDQNTGFLFGENSIFGPLAARTNDGGISWEFDSFYLVENEVSYEGFLLDGYFFDENHGQVIGHRWDDHGTISTTDNFTSWTTQHFTDILTDIDFSDENIGYASGENGLVMFTDDGGESWSQEYIGEALTLNTVEAVGDTVIIAAGEFGTILRNVISPPGLLGDINEDGNIDILDIVRLVNIIVGNPPEPTDYELWSGDFNLDGNLNVLDAIAMINMILGLAAF